MLFSAAAPQPPKRRRSLIRLCLLCVSLSLSQEADAAERVALAHRGHVQAFVQHAPPDVLWGMTGSAQYHVVHQSMRQQQALQYATQGTPTRKERSKQKCARLENEQADDERRLRRLMHAMWLRSTEMGAVTAHIQEMEALQQGEERARRAYTDARVSVATARTKEKQARLAMQFARTDFSMRALTPANDQLMSDIDMEGQLKLLKLDSEREDID